MAEIARSAAIAQVRRMISAYRDKVHEVRNDTEYLPPEGARIVNEYCSFGNDWQDLVQDAIREPPFLDMMDDGLLLEYCAVCKELDEALELGSWSVGNVERIVRGVADLSYSEKIRRAIEYSDVLNEILEEVGDINALVKQMAVVSGGLIVLSFTGLGTVAEALGFALLAAGAAFSGTDLLKGIAGLVKFFTTVDDAKTEEDLKTCGKLFGDAVAKISVDGLFFVMSMFGLKKASARLTARTIADSNPNSGKWTWKRIEEKQLKSEVTKDAEYATGIVRSRINLANGATKTTPIRATGEPISAGFRHVLQGHFNRSLGNSRSVFSITPEELKSILKSKEVIESPVSVMQGGQYLRIVNTHKIVGNTALKFGGQETSWIQIYTDKAGNLITAYPVPAP